MEMQNEKAVAAPKKLRKPRAKKKTAPDPKVLADIDSSTYRTRRNFHPGRSSTVRKLRKAARIAAMVRPLDIMRGPEGSRERYGAHGWQKVVLS